jgi:hypothetical protein
VTYEESEQRRKDIMTQIKILEAKLKELYKESRELSRPGKYKSNGNPAILPRH